MDIKTYIESGVLENYILGSLSPQETKEVQKMAAQHPEIQAELDSIESTLIDYAQIHAVEPPAFLRDKILQNTINNSSTTAATAMTTFTTTNNNWRMLAAAVGLLLLLKGAVILYFYKTNSELQAKFNTQQEQFDDLKNKEKQKEERLKNIEEKIQLLQDENIETIILKSKNNEKAQVYWKANQPIAYIDAHNVSKPPKGKQYQLWAVAKNKEATNLGSVAIDDIPVDELLKVKLKTNNFASFAISLEDLGSDNKKTPDMNAIIFSQKT